MQICPGTERLSSCQICQISVLLPNHIRLYIILYIYFFNMHIFKMGNIHSSSWLSMHYKDAEGLVEKSEQCIICLSLSNLITKMTSVFNMRDICCAVRFQL